MTAAKTLKYQPLTMTRKGAAAIQTRGIILLATVLRDGYVIPILFSRDWMWHDIWINKGFTAGSNSKFPF